MDFITRAGRVLSVSIIISSFYCSVARAYTINRFSSAIGVTLDAGELSAQLSPAAPGGKDTFISSLGGNSNFGNATDLFVQTAPNSGLIVTQRSLISFNLNSLPSNAVIVGAFYGFGITGTGGDLTTSAPPPGRSVEVRRVTQPAWTEGGATWNTYDGVNPWSTPGGAISATVSASFPLTTFFRFLSGRSYPINKFFGSGTITGDIFDVTSDAVAGFAATKSLDLAIKLDNDTTNGAAIGFSGPSSESGSSFSPQLFVIYTVPVAPPPTITAAAAAPQLFSPNASLGIDDFTSINFTLSQNANVTIKVLNNVNSLVRTLISLSPRTAGANGEVWDGKNDSGVFLPSGTYTFTIDAVGGSGSAIQQSGVVTVDNDGPIIGTSLFSFDRFTSAIGVTLGPGEQSAQIIPGPGDGKDATIHSFGSSANTNSGNATDLFVKTTPMSPIGINTDRTVVGFNLSGLPTNANIVGAFYGFGITGTGGDLTVSAPPPGRSVEIRRLTQPAWTESGVTWNTYDGANPWSTPGGDIASVISSSYPLTTFFSSAGGRSNPINKFFGSGVITGDIFDVTSDAIAQFGTNKRLDLVVKLDNDTTNGADIGFSGPSSESGTNFSPQLFVIYSDYTFGPSLNPGATVTVSYRLSEPVNATIKILNSGGGLVRNLAALSPRSAGNNSETWDGKDNSNQLVADGVYTMTLDAADTAGNNASQVAIKITVDNTVTVQSDDTTLTLTSTIPGMSVAQVPTTTPNVSLALAIATDQGLVLVSSVYDIAPSQSFSPPASIVFKFDPLVVTNTSTLAVYRFDGVQWSNDPATGILAQQVTIGADARVTASISHSSLWALFIKNPDPTPPALSLVPVSGSTVTTAAPSLAAAYADSESGISTATFRLILDGIDVTSFTVIGSSSATFAPTSPLAEGTHMATANVADYAGNVSTANTGFFIDSLAPVTTLLVNGLASPATGLVLISTDSLGLIALDSGVGILETRYSLDNSTSEVVFVSTFSLPPGAHTLAFHSVDRAGNAESAKTVTIDVLLFDAEPPTLALSPVSGSTLTTTTPALVASYLDLVRGIDLSSLRLTLDGTDVTSSAQISPASATFTPSSSLSQGSHSVTAQIADFAGNSANTMSTFYIDSLPPITALLINGLATGSTNIVLGSADTVSFAAADSGVGILETLYSVDGATEVVFASAFALSPGGHPLAFRSRDRAGNLEAARIVSISVTSSGSDTIPPLVRLDYPGSAGLGVEAAIGGVVNVRGAVSDASALTWTLEAAPGASAASGFTTVASGAGNASGLLAAWNTTALAGDQTLRLRAIDAFGNTASVTAAVFVGSPVFNFAIGRKDSNVIVNKIKNPTGIAVRSDGNIWVSNSNEDELLLLTSSGTILAEVSGQVGQSRGHGQGHDEDDDGGQGFKNPQGLALDAANNIYVADKGNDRIVKLSADGSQILLQIAKLGAQGKPKPGSGIGEFLQPQDVAVDGNGDIYAADSGNHRIQVFNAAGAFLRQFGPGVLLSTSEVRGIALTSEGLWVSDKELQVLHLFSRAGALIKTIGDSDSVLGEISRVRGLASDRLGALYVIEPNRDRTQKFDPQGKGLLAFGSKAGISLADKQAKRYLTQPIDAAVAPDGSIWITDTGRDRIVRYVVPTTGGSLAGGGASSSGSIEPAKRVVDHADGARVERDDGAGVLVPKGALAVDLEITVDKGDENLDKEQKTSKRLAIKIQAVSEEVQYGPEGTTFSAPVTLTIPYDAALVASQGIKEDDLKVYYWNPTLKDWQVMPSSVDKVAKTVNAQTTHFSAYQVGGLGGIGAAAIDDFGLRDGYAFPNPSRNGSAVTFRLQPGSVDSIEVRVYDVSGRKIHSSADFRFKGAIDDGNGKGVQNTYDQVWDVSGVGSGVYTFVMTAKKTGQSDIHKTGKVGVIK